MTVAEFGRFSGCSSVWLVICLCEALPSVSAKAADGIYLIHQRGLGETLNEQRRNCRFAGEALPVEHVCKGRRKTEKATEGRRALHADVLAFFSDGRTDDQPCDAERRARLSPEDRVEALKRPSRFDMVLDLRASRAARFSGTTCPLAA